MRWLSWTNKSLGATNVIVSLSWGLAAKVGTAERCGPYPVEMPASAVAKEVALFVVPSAIILFGSLVARREEFAIATFVANLFLLSAALLSGYGAQWPDCIPQRESEHFFLVFFHYAGLAFYAMYAAIVWLVLWGVRPSR
jgi:hypothetical protein